MPGGAGDRCGLCPVPGTDLLALLSADQSDFVWIYWGTQGFQARRLGIEIDYFPLSDYTECIPDYYSPIIISSRELITSDPELVRSFVRALRLAHQFVVDNPRESATILNTALPELALGEIEMSIAWLSQYMLHPVRGWGYQEAEKWERYADVDGRALDYCAPPAGGGASLRMILWSSCVRAAPPMGVCSRGGCFCRPRL